MIKYLLIILMLASAAMSAKSQNRFGILGDSLVINGGLAYFVDRSYKPVYDTIPAILLCNWEDIQGMTFTRNGFAVCQRFTDYYSNNMIPVDAYYPTETFLDTNRKPIPKNLIVWQYRKR